MKSLRFALAALALLVWVRPGESAPAPLVMTTVVRPPFVMQENGELAGFSIDLMRAIAAELGREVRFVRRPSFGEMLAEVEAGAVDGAIANISITAGREAVMDFSQPIFDAGLRIMVPAATGSTGSLLKGLLRWELAAALGIAFVVLLAGGMLMWLFERNRQEYFDQPARKALFPAFWWALNLVVNGGFEERVARSWPGRIFSVLLVVASLFVVSIFVAQVTTMMTVQAIRGNISSVRDLANKRVATTAGSTASAYLDTLGIAHRALPDLRDLLDEFERAKLDAVVFDAPILAWYLHTAGAGKGRLVGNVFRHEAYGIAFPQGSALVEDVNRALLRLRETGAYDELRAKWFGRPG